jgi:hypothetical protein
MITICVSRIEGLFAAGTRAGTVEVSACLRIGAITKQPTQRKMNRRRRCWIRALESASVRLKSVIGPTTPFVETAYTSQSAWRAAIQSSDPLVAALCLFEIAAKLRDSAPQVPCPRTREIQKPRQHFGLRSRRWHMAHTGS